MLDLCYCADGNKRLSEIAREVGWHLGFRSDGSFSLPDPLFIDIDYKRPDFERHVDVVAKHRPKYATIPDLSEEHTSVQDVERALKQAERLQPYCEVVLVVPKLSAQLALIPSGMAIGYSIPTSYGGAKYLPWELAGRRIHLLGGSPRKQMECYLHLSAIATVMSADGNYAQAQAVKYAMYWQRHKWHYHPEKDTGGKDLYFECWRWSCINLLKAWKYIA